jgi:hypothetical protein
VLVDDPQQCVDDLGPALVVPGIDASGSLAGLLAMAERWMPVPVWLGVVVGVAGLIVIVFSRRPVTGRSR